MSEIEQLKQQLQKQEKLASLGLLCAGIAHEIKNPLNFIINFSKISNSLLDDLTKIVESNADRLSEADSKDVSEIVIRLTSLCLPMCARSSVSTPVCRIMP